METVAIYIRLSLEDGDLCSGGKEESESITNQRKMLTEYVRVSPELCRAKVVEFCDDGYSGKNFDRPGVKKLVEAARNGEIQCIVVKDLSRFGRDYITVGNYISKVFPFLGVRFLSVNDRFDSARKGDIDSLDTAFLTLTYDLYSRDLSPKVKSAKKQLVERGVYINPVPPFGYRRDPGDKHRLLIDPAPAETVRRIFEMAADGSGTREIARALNAEHVPTPSMQKQGTSSAHANWREDNFWTRAMVSGIIRDRQYAGSLVWGKRVRKQIGVRLQATTRVEDRIVLDHHHEAIVSIELYETVQNALGGEYHPNQSPRKRDYPLRGKVCCGVCGRAIPRAGQKEAYYRCGTPATLPEAECFHEKVYEREIVSAVETAIRTQAAYAVDARHILTARRERNAALLRGSQTNLRRLENQRKQLEEQGQRLYEKLVEGTLTRESYLREKAAVLRRLEALEEMTGNLRQIIKATAAKENQFITQFSPYAELGTLTSEIAADLLDRVTVHSDGMLDIRLNYTDELQCVYHPRPTIPSD